MGVAAVGDGEVGECAKNVNVGVVASVDVKGAISDVDGVNEDGFLFFTVKKD